jgi:chemotaxis protein MotA
VLVIIGSIMVLASVGIGFIISGGNLLALWHPSEVLIIGGAALGAFIVSNPLKVVKAALLGTLGLFKGAKYGRQDYVDLLKLLYDLLQKIRKDGMIAIESDIENPGASPIFSAYPRITGDHHVLDFITDCLRLMVGGKLDPNELETLLDIELETHHKEATEPAHAVQKVADALPGFGIVAAVLGIVNTMSVVGSASPAEIGHQVAAALVGTFLGILVAYGFVGPMSAAMEQRVHEEGKVFDVVKMALVSSVRGYAPAVAVEFARKVLFSDTRPSFNDLEAILKTPR